jgi:hypothetical protein
LPLAFGVVIDGCEKRRPNRLTVVLHAAQVNLDVL